MQREERGEQAEFDGMLEPTRGPGLQVVVPEGKRLSPAQAEFNRVLKRLEKAKADLAQDEARLDRDLETIIQVAMPLVEDLNRANRDMVLAGKDLLGRMKLTVRRKAAFADLLCGKASSLLRDPVGLSEGDLVRMDAVIGELRPDEGEMDPGDSPDFEKMEFEMLRDVLEKNARNAGVNLDLSGLDYRADPEEFERMLRERIEAAAEGMSGSAGGTAGSSRKKPTKAQLAKEQRLKEREEAKKKDIKTLYKQLVKVLHPDLEADPVLRQHKETWMKRLTAAYASGDLHDLLEIEMEWLGEEVGKLAGAGEKKLKVYISVLKEQIEDVKFQRQELRYQPRYGPLLRFEDPFDGYLPSPQEIEMELREEVERHQDMLAVLTGDNEIGCRKMVNEWADRHARALKRYY